MGRRRVKGELKWYTLDLEEWPRPRPAPGVVIWMPQRVANQLVGGVYKECTELLLPGYALVASRMHWSKVEELLRVRLVRGAAGPVRVPLGDVVRLRQREGTEVWQCVSLPFAAGQNVRFRRSEGHDFAGMHGIFRGLVMTCGGFFGRVDVEVPGGGTLCGQYVPYDGIAPVDVVGDE